MSQVATSIVGQKEAAMIHTPPMQLESPRDLNASLLRPGRMATPPEGRPLEGRHQDHHHHQHRESSMTRNLVALEQNARTHPAAAAPATADDPRATTSTAATSTSTSTSTTSTTTTKAETYGEDQLCMCTPAQHVPRPSNSFILYRTRMAAQATAENPSLSNPQISKILGDRWAKESDEVKAQWKKLAEEESRRHRQQYPDYRFQPKRRGSKASQAKTPDDEPERCARCHGLRAPRTPNPATPARRRSDDPDNNPSNPPQQSSGRGVVRRASEAEAATSPTSPDPKRRRLAHSVSSSDLPPLQTWPQHEPRRPAPGPIAGGYPGLTPSSAGGSDEHIRSGGAYSQVGTPLPRPGGAMVTPRPPGTASMPPPPPPPPHQQHQQHRPPVAASWSGGPGYPSSYPTHRGPPPPDDSVRLPPLKTAITPGASPAPAELDPRFGYAPLASGLGITSSSGARSSPERGSAADQIMAIPLARKMAVVGRICPPLTGHDRRGAVISVEGSQPDLLRQVSDAVERALGSSRQVLLRSWPNDSRFGRRDRSSLAAGGELQELMPSIFQDILDWHQKSKDVTRYVVSPSSSSSSRGTSPLSPTDTGVAAVPVALVRDGFSLTMSDRFACATTTTTSGGGGSGSQGPPTNYGPVDHWQWMATLWRGIVGADLVVYARPWADDDGGDAAVERPKTVEYQRGLGAMVVRAPAGRGLDEATERRLKFEVMEWITDVWPREMSARAG